MARGVCICTRVDVYEYIDIIFIYVYMYVDTNEFVFVEQNWNDMMKKNNKFVCVNTNECLVFLFLYY